MTNAERLRQYSLDPHRWVSKQDLRDAADELDRLTAENERLREALLELSNYADSELAAWDGRNADRYWQMRRVVVKVRLTHAAALRGSEE